MYLCLAGVYKNDGTSHLIQCAKWCVSVHVIFQCTGSKEEEQEGTGTKIHLQRQTVDPQHTTAPSSTIPPTPISLLKSWSVNSPITGVFALILSVNDPQQTCPEESSNLLDSLNSIKLIRQTITYELHQQNMLILTRYRIWPANTLVQEPECTGWLVLSFVSAEVAQHGVFQR